MSSQDVKGSPAEEYSGDRRLIGLRRYWAKKRKNRSKRWVHIKGGKVKPSKPYKPKRSRGAHLAPDGKFEESFEDDDDDDDLDVSEDTEETEGDSQDDDEEEEEEGELEGDTEKMENLSQGGERKKLLQLMSEQFNSTDISAEALPVTSKRGVTLSRVTRKRKSEVLEGGDRTPETAAPPAQVSQITPKSSNPITSALKKVRKESTDTPVASTSGSPTLTRKKRGEQEKKSDRGSDERDLGEASEVESRVEESSGTDKNASSVKTRYKGRGRHLSESNENDSGTESPSVVSKGRGKAQPTSDEETPLEVKKTPVIVRGRGRPRLYPEGSGSTPSPVGRGKGRGRTTRRDDSGEGVGKGASSVSSSAGSGRGRGKTKVDADSNQSVHSYSPLGRGKCKTPNVGYQSPGQATPGLTPPSAGRGRGKKPLSVGKMLPANASVVISAKKPRGKPPLNPNRVVGGLQQKLSPVQPQSDISPSDSKRKTRLPFSQDFYMDSPFVGKRGKQTTIPEIMKKQESAMASKLDDVVKVKMEEPETKMEETDEPEELPELDADLAIELSVKAEGSSISESSFTTEAPDSKKKKKKKHFKGLKYSFGNKKKKIPSGSVSKVKKVHGISRLDASAETDSVASEDVDVESVDSSSQDVPLSRLRREADEDALDEGTSDVPDDGDMENSTHTPDEEDSMDEFSREDPAADLVDETTTHSVVEDTDKANESTDVTEENIKGEETPEEPTLKKDTEDDQLQTALLNVSAESISLDTGNTTKESAELEMELKIATTLEGCDDDDDDDDGDEEIDPVTETPEELDVSVSAAGQGNTSSEGDVQLKLEESGEVSGDDNEDEDEDEEIDPGTESMEVVVSVDTTEAVGKLVSDDVVGVEGKAEEPSAAVVPSECKDSVPQNMAHVDVYEFDEDTAEEMAESSCRYSERKLQEPRDDIEEEKPMESLDYIEDMDENKAERIMETLDHSEDVTGNEIENETVKITEPEDPNKVVVEDEMQREITESTEHTEVIDPSDAPSSETVEIENESVNTMEPEDQSKVVVADKARANMTESTEYTEVIEPSDAPSSETVEIENESVKTIEPEDPSKVVVADEAQTNMIESTEYTEVVAPLDASSSEMVEGINTMPETISISNTDLGEQTPVLYDRIGESTSEEAALKEPLPQNDHNLRGRRRQSISKRKLEDLGVEGQNSDSSDSVGDTRTAIIEGVRKSKRLSRNSSPHPLAIMGPRSPENAGAGSSKPQGSQSSYVAAPSLTNVLCKCRVKENPVAVGITGDVYCKAVDSFDGRMIGCCNLVTNHRYLRVSGKIPFALMCEIHRQRLRRHNCCPCCGLFCTQGVFFECSWDKNGLRHYYHKLCALVLGQSSLCPHCGTDQPPTEVHLELKLNRKPVIYLKQQQERKEGSARMTWSKKEEDDVPAQPEVLPEGEPSLELNGAVISAHKLPLGLDRQRLQDAIRSINAGKSFNIKPSAKGVYWACKQGDLEKLLHVLVSGVNPNVRVKEYGNQTGLHVGATYSVLAAIHVLVLAGASLDVMDMQLMSPLMVAIVKGHNDIVQYLIQAGASLMAKNQEGMTSLHLAAKCGNFAACQYILDSGRLNRHSINMQDEGGWTPLVWASENRYINVVKLLVDHGGNPQLCDVEQNTALHWAAFSGSTQICSMLLDRGCSLRSMNAHGDTPLHIASRQNHTDAVVLFLARGAHLDVLNSKQQTPLDCAVPESDVYLQLNLNCKLLDVMKQNNIRIEKILSSDLAAGKEAVPIPCVNGMDDDLLPKDYLYIADNCEASNVNIDRTITSLKWCECEDGCNADSCECGQLNFRCWYDPDGRLLPDFNYVDPPMIFECNRACRCNKLSCNNRVVQHGISAHMQLFKTDGKGWGVRALKTIQKGSYVCEYVGEIITDLEADQREDDSYLFDLDNRDGETFCIDARCYGNIARFINHLCEPNVTPVKIFIDHQDLTFPRIALFANRDIEADEELGFDYGEKFWIIKYKHFTCTCGSDKCKYSSQTIYTTLENYNQKTLLQNSKS